MYAHVNHDSPVHIARRRVGVARARWGASEYTVNTGEPRIHHTHKLTVDMMKVTHPRNHHLPDGLAPAPKLVGPIFIVGVVLIQAPPNHGKDIPDLAGQS